MTAIPQGRQDGEWALVAADVLGPFFRVDARPGPDWTSWAALCAEPELVGQRAAEVNAVVAAVREILDVEPAVVASLAHLGLVARLVSPLLGAALLTGILPVAPVERVHIRLAGVNPLPLAIAATSTVSVRGPAELVTAFHRFWLTPAIEPLTVTVRVFGQVSRQVLEGNVTSAVDGALRMAAIARPDLSAAADAVLETLLRGGPLTGTGCRRDDGSFVRRSCCLFYRLPGVGTCRDCVLNDRA